MNENDPAAPELVVEQHVAQRLIGLLLRLGYDHTLTGSQTVIFEHRRQRPRLDVCRSLGIVVKRMESRRRDVVLAHELLGKVLAALDTRSALRRPEYG